MANMEDLQPPARTIIQNNALLLRSGQFSDLTLVCQGRGFLVHQAIVCPRSPVWASAVDGGFTVSQWLGLLLHLEGLTMTCSRPQRK